LLAATALSALDFSTLVAASQTGNFDALKTSYMAIASDDTIFALAELCDRQVLEHLDNMVVKLTQTT
jgi:hypothetical protein